MGNEIVVIFGRKGSGKTTWAQRYVDEIKGEVVIVDPFAEYEGFAVYSLAEFWKAYHRPDLKRWVYRDDEIDERKFDLLCEICYGQGNITIVLEEVDWFCNPHYIPLNLAKTLKYGRHNNVNVVAISRRPAEIHRLITSQADKLVWFRFHEPNDLRYFEQATGQNRGVLTGLAQFESHVVEV